MQPRAQNHTVLAGKEFLLGPLKPQRRDKLEGVYWGMGSLLLPRILTFNIYNTLYHLSLHYQTYLFPLHHKINDVHANMWKKGGRGVSPAKLYLTLSDFSYERHLLQQSFQKAS